jgi:protein-disulfide isomerase
MEHDHKKVKTHTSSDTIEIPIGKWMHALTSHGWRTTSFVLGILLIALFTYQLMGSGGASLSGEEAGEVLVSFISAQGQQAELISAVREGALYKVVVSVGGQEAPLYVTLDGKYAVPQPIPLTNEEGTGTPRAPPAPVAVEIGTSPGIGMKNAPVTIVEFSDYQCPYCRKFWSETYHQLKKEYIDTGKVRLVFKDFPLGFHDGAQPYAEAAHCAFDAQGEAGYFRMHDKIFEEQNKLEGGDARTGPVKSTVPFVGKETLKKWARDLGFTIDTCLDSGKYAQLVADDLAYGQQVGISGTPGFFVNGYLLEGAQPYSAFKQLIDAQLAQAG